MSTLGKSYSQYGTYQAGYDHNLFWTKNHFQVVFAGSGAVTSTKKYLQRIYSNGSQGLYIPAETYGTVYMSFVAVNDTDDAAFSTAADGQVVATFENDGGTTAINTCSEVFDTNFTVAVEANDTVDALEVTIVDSGNEGDTLYLMVVLDIICMNTNYHYGNVDNRFPTISTGALSSEETPNA